MKRSLLTLLFVACAQIISLAQAPSEVSFQGYLTDDAGRPVSATLPMLFKLYDGGLEVWSENQSIEVSDGIFNVNLGTVTPLDTLRFGRPLQLGISVNRQREMTPRTDLHASAYARALPGFYTVAPQPGAVGSTPNVVGGSRHNLVGVDAYGATIGGGGAWDRPNVVNDGFSAVSGGVNNSATALYAVVGGGSSNQAAATWAAVAGGAGNTAGGSAFVGGGHQNSALGDWSMIPGGRENEAIRAYTFAAGWRAKAKHSGTFVWADSTEADFESKGDNQFLIRAAGGVGIGTNNPGSPLTVAGIVESQFGGFKFPDGTMQTSAAAATDHTHGEHWELNGNSGTTPGTDYIGTSDGAALDIRASDGVTIRHSVAGAATSLQVDGPIHSNDVDMSGLSLVMYKDTGPNLFTAPTGDGFQIYTNGSFFGPNADALVFLKTDGHTGAPDGGIAFANVGTTSELRTAMAIRGDGKVGIQTKSPVTALHVWGSPSNDSGGNHNAYVAFFENASAGPSADGIAVKIGTKGDPGSTANLIGFFDGDDDLIGQIEGNGSGGVTLNTPGADYAELLRLRDTSERIGAADVVGVHSGLISLKTEDCDRVMVVTDRPAVVGNMPAGEDSPPADYRAVSFIGQVPVRVVGPVLSGDFLIPSGLEDGSAVAIRPAALLPDMIGSVLATAWETNPAQGEKLVNAAVGIDQLTAAAQALASLRLDFAEREARILDRLARLESKLSGNTNFGP